MKTERIKLLTVPLIVAFLVISVLSGCSSDSGKKDATGDAQQAQPITLKFANQNPEGGLHGQTYNYFAQQVEKETNGQVKVQVYHSGSLVPDTDILDSIMEGTVDMAHFQNAYITTTIPEMLPFDVPGACPYTADKFDKFNEVTTPVIADIFKKYGVIYLGAIPPATLVFVGNDPVRSPADLKGKMVRTAGKWGGEAVKNWGGTPMTIPIGDVPTSLERGIIDLVHTSWSATLNFKLYEMSKHLAITNQMEVYAGIILSEKTWNKLTPEQQEGVKRAVKSTAERHGKASEEAYKQLIDAAKAKGVEVHELTDSENAAFVGEANKLLEQIKGQSGDALIKAFQQL